MEVKGQLEVGSVLPPCVFFGLSSGLQVLLTTEPASDPIHLFLNGAASLKGNNISLIPAPWAP